MPAADQDNFGDQLATLRSAVEQLQRQLAAVASAASLANHPILGNKVFLAKPGTGGAWQEQSLPGGTFTDLTDGRSGNGTGAEKLLDMASGTIAVLMVRDKSTYRYVKLGGAGGLLPVDLSDDGTGVNGTATTACTYKYNATDKAGNAVGTSLSPVEGRFVGMTTGPASEGWGYYDGGGTFVLLIACEEPETTACT